jgi:EAL domain-containing protein (putative c-di-GMP-specific phosphodiesterase class I)/GGDEF domain-containing protein
VTGGEECRTPETDREPALLSLLAEVLEHRAIRHVFQPLWHIPSAQLLGFEALARFDPPVAPDRLWEAAAATPWWAELDLLSLEVALMAARSLPGRLFVNVSARFLELVPAERDRAMALLARYRPRLDTVVLEITETAITDPVRASAGARFWQSRGVALALDDAGAGETGPERVALLRPDFVKIDRQVVQQWVDGDPRGLLRWSEWAATIGAVVVVEGLEHVDYLAALRLLGNLVVQGHAFGKPLAAAEWTVEQIRAAAPAPSGSKGLSSPVRTGRAPEWIRGNGERLWLEHRRHQAERFLSGARELVVPAVVVAWILGGHVTQAGVPAWAVWTAAAGGLGWSAVSAFWLLNPREPPPYRGHLSAVVDGLWTVAWIGVTGGAASPFLALLFWQILLALVRLTLWPAVGAALAYAAVYALIVGAANAAVVYTVLVAVIATVWWRLFEREHPANLRDDLTGFFGREYGLFLLGRALAEYDAVGLVVFEVAAANGAAGHEAEWIRAVAAAAAQAFVADCALVRYGARTFFAVCPQFDLKATVDRARAVSERVGQGVWAAHDGTVFRFDVHAGVAMGDRGMTAEQLVRHGLMALRRALTRPDRVAVWDASGQALG